MRQELVGAAGDGAWNLVIEAQPAERCGSAVQRKMRVKINTNKMPQKNVIEIQKMAVTG